MDTRMMKQARRGETGAARPRALHYAGGGLRAPRGALLAALILSLPQAPARAQGQAAWPEIALEHIAGAGDGSGRLFGLSDILAAGTHNAVLRHDTLTPLEPVETGHIALVLMGGCTEPVAPTPTPIACDEAVLSLGAEVLVPGQEVKFFGCIPAMGQEPMDLYLVAFSPTGFPSSAVYPGYVVPGIRPYAEGIANPLLCQCRDLFTHVVCENPQTGVWTAVLAVLPTGAPATAQNIVTYAQQSVTVTL